jgi:ferredoxin
MFGLRYLPGVTTLELHADRCNGCGLCARVCPHAVFVLEEARARIADRDACMECGACARNCPEAALSVQAGVGCAAAVINSVLRGGEACCGPGDTPCCG